MHAFVASVLRGGEFVELLCFVAQSCEVMFDAGVVSFVPACGAEVEECVGVLVGAEFGESFDHVKVREHHADLFGVSAFSATDLQVDGERAFEEGDSDDGVASSVCALSHSEFGLELFEFLAEFLVSCLEEE